MLQHVVIRQESYVAGTRERPEVGIFTQTHSSRPPVPWGALASMGQRCPSDVSRAPTSASRRGGSARRGSTVAAKRGDARRREHARGKHGRAMIRIVGRGRGEPFPLGRAIIARLLMAAVGVVLSQ